MSDRSANPSIQAAATMAITADSSVDDATDASFSITESMIKYLRMEANQAEDKAKKLRKQAAEIAEQFGITEESQHAYDLDPTQLPPLDENGVPKYRGKKRGRKPKAKKRKMKLDRPKRKHTGYTLFMQEVYPAAKSESPDLPSKELIRLIARRWKHLDTSEKAMWKERANEGRVVGDSGTIGGNASLTTNSGTIDSIANIASLCSNEDSYPASRTDDDEEDREAEVKHIDATTTAQRALTKKNLEENLEEHIDDEDIDTDIVVDEDGHTRSDI